MRGVTMLACIAVVLVSAPGAADEIKYGPEFRTCMESGDAAKGVTPAMKACLDAEAKRWDNRLNRVYRQILQATKCDPARREKVVGAQRQWLAYRKARCEVYAGLTGGTIDRLQVSSCWLEELARKTRELEEIRKLLPDAPSGAC